MAWLSDSLKIEKTPFGEGLISKTDWIPCINSISLVAAERVSLETFALSTELWYSAISASVTSYSLLNCSNWVFNFVSSASIASLSPISLHLSQSSFRSSTIFRKSTIDFAIFCFRAEIFSSIKWYASLHFLSCKTMSWMIVSISVVSCSSSLRRFKYVCGI